MSPNRPDHPRPPRLPEDTHHGKVPAAVREFVTGRTSRLTLEPGPVDWLDLPVGLAPDVAFRRGRRRQTVEVTVSLDVVVYTIKVTLVGELREGRLHLDTAPVRDIAGLGNPREAIDDWVDGFNLWLAHQGRRLGQLKVRRGRLVVTTLPVGTRTSVDHRRRCPRRRALALLRPIMGAR
jgi:hypothetical protein